MEILLLLGVVSAFALYLGTRKAPDNGIILPPISAKPINPDAQNNESLNYFVPNIIPQKFVTKSPILKAVTPVRKKPKLKPKTVPDLNPLSEQIRLQREESIKRIFGL